MQLLTSLRMFTVLPAFRHRLAWSVILEIVLATLFCAGAVQPAVTSDKPRQLTFENKRRAGDFDGMLERRMIRVLVPYSRTLYYNDKGNERGITVELVRDFERYLNTKYAKELQKRPITVYVIPATRDVLIEDVAKGRGDIAAGNLTETAGRLKRVDFVAPRDRKPVSELVMTGPASPAVVDIDDLAGKRFHVRKASSYYTSLIALNKEFRKRHKAQIKLTLVPDALEDEDLMEMLNAGLVELIVVDDWKARMWAQVLPQVKVSDVAIAQGGYTGWAIRKGSPNLAKEITAFYVSQVQKQGVIEYRGAQHFKHIKFISNNTAGDAWKRLEQMLGLFKTYGAKYRFDPLMLAAQGYQESQLRQNVRSPGGAIGVMQLMPTTGAAMEVGNIVILEPNIHAGAKYMDHLMSTYFPDARFSEHNRTLFALASYSAGPGRIGQMRELAQERELDPDQWFNNVELVVAEKVGIETTTYVRNIFKYYVAYKLQLEVLDARRKAKEKLAPTAK